MHNDEDFEDELDRMRTRRKRKSSQTSFKTPSPEEDDDFVTYDSIETIVAKERPEKRRSAIKKRRKKKVFAKLLCVLAVLLIGIFLFQRIRDDGYWTIAIFGVDSRDGNLGKGALADVSMVCSINKKTGEMRLVSVFRDSYLRIDNKDTYHKINEAYFKGGYKQAVEALEQNLDLKIDDYAVFNWKAVVDAINVLGGVDLEITDREFAYINSFITETVNSTGVGSHHLTQSGANHLDGVQAVAYARLRLMDTDFNRTERQRKVLGLAMDKTKGADFGTLKTLVGTVFPQVSTSIGVDNVLSLAKNARKYYIGQSSGFPFSHTEMKIGKMDCVIPTTLESNVVQLHEFLYDDSNYRPSSMVQKISGYISEKSGLGDPGKDVESDRKPPSGGSQNKPAESPAPQETPPPETELQTESTEESSSESESESVEESTITPLEPGETTGTTAVPAEPETNPSLPHTTEAPKETTGVLEGPGQGTQAPDSNVVGPGVSQ